MENVIDVLKERGFIEAMSSEELRSFAEKPLKVYCGFDPTSDSLHLGNFVAIMGLAWFQRYGHTPYVIVGGATGMVGDPSGKSSERVLLDNEAIQKNLAGIKKNLETILKSTHPHNQPVFLNNYDWFKNFSLIDFLRDIAKSFRMGPMLSKESVRARLNSEDGMSFTEFSYQLLQGYDFYHLFQEHGVTLQLGGSDQWGNMTGGTDLIRKLTGKPAYAITFPLLTRTDGQKFGKSEKGAIWLSPEKLSPYEFYQYLYRVEDADVIKLMRMLTFMDMAEIKSIEEQMRLPGYLPNTAQKRLAEEVTRIVHGEEALEKALKITQAAAPGAQTKLDSATLEALAVDIPCHAVDGQQFEGVKLIDLLVQLGLQASKGEARKFLKNGGVSINNEKVLDENIQLSRNMLIDNQLLLITLGKKNKVLVRVK